ncbi:tetratricopeptide repeat protein [Crocosphaera sp.]|uniref:tetratricopeptide repeat protein n=1 Tax=Crocosphaera sp. TaxID=2729996 RepID=UPI003F20A338
MNEEQFKAYVNLIQALLNCPQGEEPNILQENEGLINPEFLQVVNQYADGLEQEQPDNNNAAWLRSFIFKEYTKGKGNNMETYENFFLEALQVEWESNDPAVVYPLLKQHQHLLDDVFAQLLPQYARNLFSQSNPEETADIVGVIENLCIHIKNFPLGSRADNLEIAIKGYETVLEMRHRDTFPYEWAMTQNNLGNAYKNRIRGERADNLEEAIAAYERSLEVYTRDAFPYEWARSQNNLGTAYGDRIRGERADNLEAAIAAYERSLEVRTRDAFPEDWARSQNNLGNAYSDRIRGERSDNLEAAIAAYERSLEVYTRDAFPEDWARSQHNLGTAYSDRIRGERSDNLEAAIAAYERSLEVYTRDAFPYEWARSQNNLGNAYSDRIKGDPTDNLEMAISCYQQALNIRTLNSFPLDWAQTQYNLGNAYSRRSMGDETENLNQAIICYENVLKVYSGKTFPDYWAQIKYNLGNSYRQRFQLLNNPDDIKQAIFAYQQAKAIFEKTADADLIFDSYYQLGRTFFEGGYYTDASQHLETCSQTYRNSKNVPHLAPILFELARVYHRRSLLEKARLNFKDSLRLFRRLKDEENTYSVMVALSNLEIQTGKVKQAYDHLKEAQTYYQTHPDSQRLEEINNLLNILQLT